MKRRLTQVIGSITLFGTFLGGAQTVMAQDDLEKELERALERAERREEDREKLNRWVKRLVEKRTEQLTEENKFGSAYTARGSAIRFINSQGQYVTIGYIDKRNEIHLYRK